MADALTPSMEASAVLCVGWYVMSPNIATPITSTANPVPMRASKAREREGVMRGLDVIVALSIPTG
jgi:hypothetical protein